MSQPALNRFPGFFYSAPEKLDVFAFVPGKFPDESLSDEGKYVELGSTRRWFGFSRSVYVPDYTTWGVSGELEDVLVAAKRDHASAVDLTENTKLTDADLARLAEIDTLLDVTLPPWSAITDVGLAHLTKLSKLRSLGLGGLFRITDAGLDHVAQLRDLVHLDLSFEREGKPAGFGEAKVPITNAGLAKLATLQKLKVLELRGAWVTNEGLQHVAKLRIRGLALYDIDGGECQVSEADREAFQKACPTCEMIEW